MRTFSPILEYYCSTGNQDSVLRLFREMRSSPGVYFDSATYALIIGSLAKLGVFQNDSNCCESALDYGFSSTFGRKLFDEIMNEMADDLLDISEHAALELVKAFNADPKAVKVDEISPSSSDGDRGLLLGRVRIDEQSGLCPVSGAKLRLFALEETQRNHVHDTLLELARTQQVEFAEKVKRQRRKRGQSETLKDMDEDGERGVEELSRFSDWLRYVAKRTGSYVLY